MRTNSLLNDVRVTALTERDDLAWSTFETLPEWYVLFGRCPACGALRFVDREKLARKWGRSTYIYTLMTRLSCTSCGNRDGNKIWLGKLKR